MGIYEIIVIYFIKKSPPEVYAHFYDLSLGDVVVSAITVCELQFGVAKSTLPEKNQLALTGFLAPLQVLDFPSSGATWFGQIRAELQAAGTPIDNYDLLIAAHALALDAILVTNNTGEFSRIRNLKIENWVQP